MLVMPFILPWVSLAKPHLSDARDAASWLFGKATVQMLAILAFGGCKTRMFDVKCFLHMIRSVRSSAAKPLPSDAHGVPQVGFLNVKAYVIQLMMLVTFILCCQQDKFSPWAGFGICLILVRTLLIVCKGLISLLGRPASPKTHRR